MKKVLLSLSMLAATVFAANAQNFVIWDASTSTGFASAGTAFVFSPGASSFTVDTTAGVITAAGVAGSNCGTSGTDACYYINGFGNGAYAAPVPPSTTSLPTSFGYTAANFATDKFFMNVNAPGMKVKIQFTSFTAGVADADIYGYEFDLTSTTAAYADRSILMSSFSKIVQDNPNGTNFLTASIAQRIGKIEIVVVKTANGGVGAGSVKLKNMTIGNSSVITATSAASNISSAVVYPNPANGVVSTNLTLQNAASVSVIVTDMVGKQIATQNFGTVSSLNGVTLFDASTLAKGMYTVTYVLDGAPAKTELVVVK